ncbi:Beta/gamma crystallin domain-containing protein 1 [Saguinus oedipus]|uniref:Beta/gamma crystallin domain-containing protein 1 n=1 Tax=Saguinus oedipus TaxID=9490 RepID=A0ABQ9VXL1_SAGOE|nr:Beta/gamma crystallin domain-containing protein 1 [Saguinus oedipus]
MENPGKAEGELPQSRNSSRQENAETPARSAGHEQEASSGARGAPGSPTRERPTGGLGEAPDGAPSVYAEGGSLGPRDACSQPPEGTSAPPAHTAGSAQADGTARPARRAHPAKVLTLDIYLKEVQRPQKSTDSPGADADLPESTARDDAVFDDERIRLGGKESEISAGGPRRGRCLRGEPRLRGESDRSKQPPLASSPTKRKGRSRETLPAPLASGLRAPAKESPPKRAPDPAAESGEEAAGTVPRELSVKSSSLLPEIKPEHKRGPLPFDGRAEGERPERLELEPFRCGQLLSAHVVGTL